MLLCSCEEEGVPRARVTSSNISRATFTKRREGTHTFSVYFLSSRFVLCCHIGPYKSADNLILGFPQPSAESLLP